MSLIILPRQLAVDVNGTPRNGAKLYVYAPGTTTPITAYTTPAYSVAHSSPILSASTGLFPAAYVNPGVNATYKILIKDSADVTLYSEDNIPAAVMTQAEIGQTLYPRTAAEINASITPTNYWYPEGYVDRYGTNTTPGTTDMTAAANAARDVAEQNVALHNEGGIIYWLGNTYLITDNFRQGMFVRSIGVGPLPSLVYFGDAVTGACWT